MSPSRHDRGSARTGAVVTALALLALAAVWLSGGSDGAGAPAPARSEARTETQSAAATEPRAPAPPTTEPSRESAPSPREETAPTPVFDEATRTLSGRVHQHGVAPNGEEPVVVLGTWTGADDLIDSIEGPLHEAPEWQYVEAARTEVDERGRFALRIPPDVHFIRLRVDGQFLYCYNRAEYVLDEYWPPEDELVLEVGVGARVELRYVDDGEPIAALAGREVIFMGPSFEVRRGAVDGRGRLTLRGLSPGEYHHALYEGWYHSDEPEFERYRHDVLAPYSVTEERLFTCGPGDDIEVEVPLVLGKRLQGVAVDSAGAPVPGARWMYTFDVGSPTGFGHAGLEGLADSGGRFEILAPPHGVPGTLTLYGSERWFGKVAGEVVEQHLESGAPLRVVMTGPDDPIEELEIAVRLPDGRPVPQVRLRARFDEPLADGGLTEFARMQPSDDDGIAALQYRTEAPIEIWGSIKEVVGRSGDASAPNRFEQRRTRPGDVVDHWYANTVLTHDDLTRGEPVEIVLERLPTVVVRCQGPLATSGRVSGVTMTPISRADWLAEEGSGSFDRSTGVLTARRAPGTYALEPYGHAITAPRTVVEVPAGAERVEVSLDLIGRPTRAFDVVDSNGEAVRYAWFHTETASGARQRMKTSREGRLVIAGDPGGETRLYGGKDGEVFDRVITFPDAADGSDEVEVIQLQPGASIVLDVPEGARPKAWALFVEDPTSSRRWHGRATDEGVLRASPIPAGAWAARVVHDGVTLAVQAIHLSVGETARIDAREIDAEVTTLRGRILAGGEPLRGIHAVLEDAGIPLAAARTDEAGRVAWRTVYTGELTLSLHGSEPEEGDRAGVFSRVPEPPFRWLMAGDPGETAFLASFPIQVDGGTADLGDITLPGGYVAGTSPVRLVEGPAGHRVVARRIRGGRPIERDANIRSYGWSIPLLAPGEYEVTVRDHDGAIVDSIAPATFEIEENERVSGVALTLAPR